MRIGLTVTIVILSCILGGHNVFSWSEVGHMAIANIAVKDLLRQGYKDVVEITKNMSLYGSKYTPNMTESIEGASIFADETRDFQDIHLYDEYHFATRIYNPKGLFIKPTPPMRDVVNTVKTIRNSFNVMKQGGKSRNLTAEKSFILRMLLHTIGDFHQPSHIGGLWNEEFPLGDNNGKKFTCRFDIDNPQNFSNVHEFWNHGAGFWPHFTERPINKQNMSYVEKLADEIMTNVTRQHLKDELAEKNIDKWAQAVYDFLPEVVYQPLMKNGRVINKEYQAMAYPLIVKQLALAGYRLADMLKQIFSLQMERPFTAEDLEIPELGNTEARMRIPLVVPSTKAEGMMSFLHRKLSAVKQKLTNFIKQ